MWITSDPWLRLPKVPIRYIAHIARFMWPIWGPPGADRTQVGPMLAPWTLLPRWWAKWWRSTVMLVVTVNYICFEPLSHRTDVNSKLIQVFCYLGYHSSLSITSDHRVIEHMQAANVDTYFEIVLIYLFRSALILFPYLVCTKLFRRGHHQNTCYMGITTCWRI